MFKRILYNKVFQNISYLTIGNILAQLLGLITLVRIARVFTPNDYGLYSFLLIQGQLLITIGDLGIQNIVIRSIARDKYKTKELLVTGIKLKIIAVLLLSGIYVLYNAFCGTLSQGQVLLIVLFTIFNCSTSLLQSIFWGYQKMLSSSVIDLLWSIVWVSIVFLFPLENIDVTILFIGFSVITFLKGMTYFRVMVHEKLLLGEVKTFFISAKHLLQESWPYFSLVLVMLPVNYLSNNFLDINSTKAEIAYFNLANKVMTPLSMVIGYSLLALFPNLSSLWTEDENKFNRLISFGFEYLFLFALLLCFLFTLFANEIIVLVFSAKYTPAVEVCQLQIWFVFLMSIDSLIGTIWGSINKEKLVFQTAVVNALITTPMIYFGSKYGALGMSYGYVIGFAIFEIYLWIVFRRSVDIRIKGDWLLWAVTVVLFFFSYFILNHLSLWMRLIPAAVLTTGLSFYSFKSIKAITVAQ
jgi:O-antigen/teichoic acid export membrane protein